MKKGLFIFSLITLGIVLSTCTKDKGPLRDTSCDAMDNTYLTGIKPIIDTRCAIPGCHQVGFLPGDYTTYAGIKAKFDAGTLENRMFILGDMPPPTSDSLPLTATQLQQFRCWMNAGAPNN